MFGIRNVLCLVSEILCAWYQKYLVFGIRNDVISDIKILVSFDYQKQFFVFGIRNTLCLVS